MSNEVERYEDASSELELRKEQLAAVSELTKVEVDTPTSLQIGDHKSLDLKNRHKIRCRKSRLLKSDDDTGPPLANRRG